MIDYFTDSCIIICVGAGRSNPGSCADYFYACEKAKEENMKKFSAVLAAAAVALSLAACGDEDVNAKSDGVMTYAQYAAASLDTEVTVETYVQAKQSWWEDNGVGQATLYTQDGEGGYFIYNMAMTEEEYKKLSDGTKIKVTGFKSEWSGEVEIIDGKFEIESGNYVAKAEDVTSLLGSDDLAKKQNLFVSFKGMTVEASGDNGAAFLYNWDGSGEDGSDLYFNASVDGKTYTFTVESYLCGKDTDVYKAVKELKVGDKIDMEGFLYWYNGANPHITSVKAAK